MSTEIGRNCPCWCGSGQKYKRCCLARDEQVCSTRQDTLRAYRRAFGKWKCLHPQASDSTCSRGVASAHSIAKGYGLKAIARDNHVYCFTTAITDFYKHRMFIVPRLEGINEASTFGGFCSLHDSETFKRIDAPIVEVDEEVAFLLAYRALCKTLHTFKGVRELRGTRRSKPKDITNPYAVGIAERSNRSRKAISHRLQSLWEYKQCYDRVVISKDFTQVGFYTVRMEGRSIFSCNGVTDPDFDFQGNVIRNPEVLDSSVGLLTFSMLPSERGQLAILSWLNPGQGCVDLARSLGALTDKDLPNGLIRFMFEYFENTFASPSWWDTAPPDIRERLFERRISRVVEDACYSTCLLDDGARYVDWRVVSRNCNFPLSGFPDCKYNLSKGPLMNCDFYQHTQDCVERDNLIFIKNEFPEYAEFWNTHIGVRDGKSLGAKLTLLSYAVKDKDKPADSATSADHFRLCMAHYSQFLHIVGVRTQLQSLRDAEGAAATTASKLMKMWPLFFYCYAHLGSILYLENCLWTYAKKFAWFGPQEWNQPSDIITTLGDAKLAAAAEEINKRIKSIRDNLIHWTRPVADLTGDKPHFHMLGNSGSSREGQPTWHDLADGQPFDPAEQAKKDWTDLLKVLRCSRGFLRNELSKGMKKRGLTYEQPLPFALSTNPKDALSGTTETTIFICTQANASASLNISASGSLYHK